jgi:hypothetical protein
MPSAVPFVLLFALAAGLRAETPLISRPLEARRAAALLGAGGWKRVIVIENANPASRYPRSLGALVFEMGGLLWFYTPSDGTQSLSQLTLHAAQDENNLGPLLRAIDPGFTHWEFDVGAAVEPGPAPPNACLLESLALLRRRAAQGATVAQPWLLSYYVAVPGGVRGHTVAFLLGPEGPLVLDPHFPRRQFRIRTRHWDDAKQVADCLRGDIASARWVPVDAGDYAPGPGSPDVHLLAVSP